MRSLINLVRVPDTFPSETKQFQAVILLMVWLASDEEIPYIVGEFFLGRVFVKNEGKSPRISRGWELFRRELQST
ncbi:hypothetical protein DP117_34110 [Brasilonema sp. UFV-L1]|nr:hypothetical protein [Brasilonema sp. UFV-L1]